MTPLESNNILARYAIPDLCGKNFFIPDYQRGYRWSEVQVKQLLEDLCRFFYGKEENQGDFYCLQPIVVKELSIDEIIKYDLHSNFDNNRWYEVVDGQQRLTTVRILLALFSLFDDDFNLAFGIYYMTRKDLGQLFSQLKLHKGDDNSYQVYLDKTDDLDIDSWHILQAANLILAWFGKTAHTGFSREINISTFKKVFSEDFVQPKAKKSVQVIWYELRDGSLPMEMFKRLNDKKVSLNNAELVRAMFLSDSAKYPCGEEMLRHFKKESRNDVQQREKVRKQGHIIEQWDLIEHQLQQPSFWSFIKQEITTTQDSKAKTYDCRIEYLFDLITHRRADESDNLYTYIAMEKMVSGEGKNNLWELWLKVEHYFSILRAWYEDDEYYHRIGFLTTELGATVLADLLENATQKSKSLFKEDVEKRIFDAIHDNKKSGKILLYNYLDNYKLLKRVLFLFNVETSLKAKERFDFDRYKQQEWTLEHIHAQNSERIDHSQKEKWFVWFDENKRALDNLNLRFGDEPHFKEVYDAFTLEKEKFDTSRNKYTFEDLSLIFDKVLTYFNALIKTEEGIPTMTHDISNMALLSREINSSVSNSVFEVKRQRIKKLDANGVYIPPCTRKVFLKYYNKTADNFSVQQEFYWSERDRIHYAEAIRDMLQPYILREGGQEYE